MKEGKEIMLKQFGKDQTVRDAARREKRYGVLNGELGGLHGGVHGVWIITDFMFSV